MRDLRRTFRRVVWAGPVPGLPPGPVVAFANHQSYYDGHLMWLLARRLLARRFAVWMEELDRFPFLASQGALPFPPRDPHRRATTLRATRRLLRADPDTMLAYFPEGILHGADDHVRPWSPDALRRLHHVLGRPAWWPIGIHVTWRGESRPTAVLGGAGWTRQPPREATGGLEQLRTALRESRHAERTLIEGTASPAERWSFGWTRSLVARS